MINFIKTFPNLLVEMLKVNVIPQTSKTHSATVIFFHGSGKIFFISLLDNHCFYFYLTRFEVIRLV